MKRTPDAKRESAWRRATTSAFALLLLTLPTPSRAEEPLFPNNQSPAASFLTCAISEARLHAPAQHGLRRPDRWGSGTFGASRDHGARIHRGLDFAATPGEPVYAPTSGMVRRIGIAYPDSDAFALVEIETSAGCTVRVLYVAPTVRVGESVVAGQIIGKAEDLASRYRGITAHVHLEVRINGVAIDPTAWFAAGETSDRSITLASR